MHLCSIDENKKKSNNITVLFACFPCTVHAYIDFVLLISASLLLWHRLISNKYYFAGHSSNINKLSNHLRNVAYSIRYANTLAWSNTQGNINYIPISTIIRIHLIDKQNTRKKNIGKKYAFTKQHKQQQNTTFDTNLGIWLAISENRLVIIRSECPVVCITVKTCIHSAFNSRIYEIFNDEKHLQNCILTYKRKEEA